MDKLKYLAVSTVLVAALSFMGEMFLSIPPSRAEFNVVKERQKNLEKSFNKDIKTISEKLDDLKEGQDMIIKRLIK